jgi:uncharacterized pyridoxal phosphate-dependent enzyme
MLQELKVKPIINARGPFTVLGGSRLDDEVMSAIDEVRGHFFDMDELNRNAGELLAKMIGVEAAFITSGAEAGLILSVAACMTRGIQERMNRLPDTEGMPNEVIVQRLHRNLYDYGLQITGAKVKEVGNDIETTARDMSDAFGTGTAAVLYFAFDPQTGVLPLSKVVDLAHSRNVPVIVDAAGELPPPENLSAFTAAGADLTVFSGGKDIGAPNDTGIVLGSKELISICRQLGPHSYETIDSRLRVYLGRPMKTSKEDVVATVAAVKRYLKTDQAARMRGWERMATYIRDEVSRRFPGLEIKIVRDSRPRPPMVPKVQLNLKGSGVSFDEIQQDLMKRDPNVFLYSLGDNLIINPHCLVEGEQKIVAERLIEILWRRLGQR